MDDAYWHELQQFKLAAAPKTKAHREKVANERRTRQMEASARRSRQKMSFIHLLPIGMGRICDV